MFGNETNKLTKLNEDEIMSTLNARATVEAVIKVEIETPMEEIREFYGSDSTPTAPLIAAFFKHRGACALKEELTIINPKGLKLTVSTGAVTVLEPKSPSPKMKRKSAKGA